MRVKVGDTWYDGNEVPIMVQLDKTGQDIYRLQHMPDDNDRYCLYPDGYFDSREEVLDWMDEGYEVQEYDEPDPATDVSWLQPDQ